MAYSRVHFEVLFISFFILNFRNKICNLSEDRLSDLNLLSNQLETTENTEPNDTD